jgi:hypothetical protein
LGLHNEAQTPFLGIFWKIALMAPPHYARTLQMFEITLQHYSEVTIRTRMVSEGNFRYLPKYGKNKNYEFQKLRTEHGGFHNLTSKKVLFMSDCKTYLKNNFQSRLMPAFLEEKK